MLEKGWDDSHQVAGGGWGEEALAVRIYPVVLACYESCAAQPHGPLSILWSSERLRSPRQHVLRGEFPMVRESVSHLFKHTHSKKAYKLVVLGCLVYGCKLILAEDGFLFSPGPEQHFGNL